MRVNWDSKLGHYRAERPLSLYEEGAYPRSALHRGDGMGNQFRGSGEGKGLLARASWALVAGIAALALVAEMQSVTWTAFNVRDRGESSAKKTRAGM